MATNPKAFACSLVGLLVVGILVVGGNATDQELPDDLKGLEHHLIPRDSPGRLQPGIPFVEKASRESMLPKPEPAKPFLNRVSVSKKAKVAANVDMESLQTKMSQLRPSKKEWEAKLPAHAKLTIVGWGTHIESVETKDGYTEVTAHVQPRVESALGGVWIIGATDAMCVYRIDSDGNIEQTKRQVPEEVSYFVH